LRLYLVATDTGYNKDFVSGVTQCFTYVKRLLPSTLTDIVGDDVTLEQTRKRARLFTSDNLSAEEERCRKLFCPHKLKPVNFLLPRREGHLVAVTNISGSHDVALTGVKCSVVITWTDDDVDAAAVYQTCGHVTLCAKDVVSPQFGLLFDTSSVFSGRQTFCVLLAHDRRQHKHGVCYCNSSVCPSVCSSVMRVDQSKTVEVRIMQFSPYSSPIPLTFVG